MLFRTITKEHFRKLVNGIINENQTIGPKAVDMDAKGNPVYQFVEVSDFDEMNLEYPTTYSSAKHYFLPFKENLSTFEFEKKGWKQKITYNAEPRVIVGLRAFDINGLLKLDNVLMKEKFPNPYYITKRKNTFIIGIDHEAPDDCFARSLNADVVLHGFDMFMTDIGDKYFLLINSSNAFNVLKNVTTEEITRKDEERYIAKKKKIENSYKTVVDVTGLPSLLDIEFESDVWKKWGDKCLSCGSCAMVCPTCYCYTVNESIDPSLKFGVKERMLYSCNIVDFAEVAGGHNFRPKASTRLKYRYYHQHRGFVESYDEPKCVGCNRCGRACPAGINPVDVIHDLRMEGGR
ncbi:MAG: hydrogenase [Deltaproteobacteria bacterium RBG_13_49_15]|nr:MAG: hydrogenase [Deltaproteobacteria bacterium RBG_13_49_15]